MNTHLLLAVIILLTHQCDSVSVKNVTKTIERKVFYDVEHDSTAYKEPSHHTPTVSPSIAVGLFICYISIAAIGGALIGIALANYRIEKSGNVIYDTEIGVRTMDTVTSSKQN